MSKKIVEIDGKRYMTPAIAAGLWEMSTQRVVSACQDDRIPGVFKDTSGHFIIPVDAKKPLERDMIRDALIAILQIKNRSESVFEIENNRNIIELLMYLEATGFVDGTSLSNTIISDKGMVLATSGKKTELDWRHVSVTLLNIAGSVASIISLM